MKTDLLTRIRSWKLSGYSLVMVLSLISIFSVVTLLIINQSLFVQKNTISYHHLLQRKLIAESFCDSLESVEKFNPELLSEKVFSYSDQLGYKISVTATPIYWGIKTFLKLTVFDHLGSEIYWKEISKRFLIPEQTVLLYDNPSFGLAYSTGADINGQILLRRPEFRTERNYSRTIVPKPFTGKIYQLKSSALSYSGSELRKKIDNLSNVSQENKEFNYFEINESQFNFDTTKFYINTIFLFKRKINLTDFPKGSNNQFIFLNVTSVNFSGQTNGLILGLGDTLTIKENSMITSDIYFLEQVQPHTRTAVLNFEKKVKVIGNVISDAVFSYDNLNIDGLVAASNFKVNRPPTTYGHYLIDLTISSSSSKTWFDFPFYWTEGDLHVQ